MCKHLRHGVPIARPAPPSRRVVCPCAQATAVTAEPVQHARASPPSSSRERSRRRWSSEGREDVAPSRDDCVTRRHDAARHPIARPARPAVRSTPSREARPRGCARTKDRAAGALTGAARRAVQPRLASTTLLPAACTGHVQLVTHRRKVAPAAVRRARALIEEGEPA